MQAGHPYNKPFILFCLSRSSAIELLHSTYHSLSEMERKLYLYSPQLVARIDQAGQLHSSLLFEPPRVPDHRQGLEEGLRALLTWLVSHDRVAEAQGWAQLSRMLMESLPDLDYLDKAAQVSIFVWAIKPVGAISICRLTDGISVRVVKAT